MFIIFQGPCQDFVCIISFDSQNNSYINATIHVCEVNQPAESFLVVSSRSGSQPKFVDNRTTLYTFLLFIPSQRPLGMSYVP